MIPQDKKTGWRLQFESPESFVMSLELKW